MTNPEAPAVTGTILELYASELGPDHVGRPVRFHVDGRPVHGVISKIDTEHYDLGVLVELGGSNELYNLGLDVEVIVITETAAEAISRLGQLHVVEQGGN